MACTIDHLRVDHRVRVKRNFSDLAGVTLAAGESAVVRGLGLDYGPMEIWIELEWNDQRTRLRFALRAVDGPRIGHMQDFFEMGEDVTTPRNFPMFHDPSLRKMRTPQADTPSSSLNPSAWSRAAQSTDGPDRLEWLEEEMRRSIDHIGVAASIAEMYAERMRAFQRVGNEVRAIAAFKLAVDWMGAYAGWATSGGEGAALSHERDQFQTALAREFGYDPTKNP